MMNGFGSLKIMIGEMLIIIMKILLLQSYFERIIIQQYLQKMLRLLNWGKK